jgi:hypothetical protein
MTDSARRTAGKQWIFENDYCAGDYHVASLLAMTSAIRRQIMMLAKRWFLNSDVER